MKHEVSFGIIPLREQGGVYEALLVQLHAGHWGFPKGHKNPGETDLEAALRELKEETNLSVIRFLNEVPYDEIYFFRWEGVAIRKNVRYYLALVEGELKIQPEEIKNAKFVPLNQLIKAISFKEGKALAQKVISFMLVAKIHHERTREHTRD